MKHIRSLAACIGCLLLLLWNGCDKPTEPEAVRATDSIEDLNAPLHGHMTGVITPDGDTLWSAGTSIAYSVVHGQQTKIRVGNEDISYSLTFQRGDSLGKRPVHKFSLGEDFIRLDQSSNLEILEGSVNLTHFDLEKHELSATVTFKFKLDTASSEEHIVISKLNRIDIYCKNHHPAGGVLKVFDVSIGSNDAGVSFRGDSISMSGYNFHQSMAHPCLTYQTHRLKIAINKPSVGVFYPGRDAQWSAEHDIGGLRLGPGCPDGFTRYNPEPTDSLVVTAFDPINKRISGTFTLSGRSGSFTFGCWIRSY